MIARRHNVALPPIGHGAPPDTASPNWPVCAALLLAMFAVASGVAVKAYDHAVAAFAPPADRHAVSFKIEARWCDDHQPYSCADAPPALPARIDGTARADRSSRRAPAVSFHEAQR